MASLQATWTKEGTLFFWAAQGKLNQVLAAELPGILGLKPLKSNRSIAVPALSLRRKPTTGLELAVGQSIQTLIELNTPAAYSETIQCWSFCAKFAVELAAAQRVIPTVHNGEAKWRALISRTKDRHRLKQLAAALPPAGRSIPTNRKGRIRLQAPHLVIRQFIDATIDHIYRQNRYPGSCRSWELSFAEALKGPDCAFQIRDARHQNIPEKLRQWSASAEASSLQLLIKLELTDEQDSPFRLIYFVRSPEVPEKLMSADAVWAAGDLLQIGDQRTHHPAYTLIRFLARAARIFPPLADSLKGPRPRALRWQAKQAWEFLSTGVRPLIDAGFYVDTPDGFERFGGQRVRAQMRLSWDQASPHPFIPEAKVPFTWEVLLGDEILDVADFTDLLAKDSPLVYFRGSWIILEPSEVQRLPEGLVRASYLPGPCALKAVLTGRHEGVKAIADPALSELLEALIHPEVKPTPTSLKGTLRPYQQVGFSWLCQLGALGLGGCLADDMGLGKTIQLITYLLHRKQCSSERPHLIVCPTSVIGNWTREFTRFAPRLTIAQFHGNDRVLKQATDSDVVITTYGILVRDKEALAQISWGVVALDEAQAIKNAGSWRSRAARELRAEHRIALTGTPVENRLDDLWSLMAFLNPSFLGTRTQFTREIALPIERFGDDRTAEYLKQQISPFLLRRLKNDPSVIQDLPEKLERRIYCSLSSEQTTLYEAACQTGLENLSTQQNMERRGNILALLTSLKQICNHPSHYLGDDGPLEHRSEKLERCIFLLRTIADRGEYAILFTQYREMGIRIQRTLRERFGWEVPFLHGGSTVKQREQLVGDFQGDSPSANVLLVSLRAGGTGLNLTRATHVIHFDRWWNPAVEDQATDRAYRIGQQQTVHVYKLVCQGTLEERIDGILEEKRSLAETVMGSGEGWLTELDDQALSTIIALGKDAYMRS
jgi:hypothetical protein